jgi:hypothetical protein
LPINLGVIPQKNTDIQPEILNVHSFSQKGRRAREKGSRAREEGRGAS